MMTGRDGEAIGRPELGDAVVRSSTRWRASIEKRAPSDSPAGTTSDTATAVGASKIFQTTLVYYHSFHPCKLTREISWGKKETFFFFFFFIFIPPRVTLLPTSPARVIRFDVIHLAVEALFFLFAIQVPESNF